MHVNTYTVLFVCVHRVASELLPGFVHGNRRWHLHRRSHSRCTHTWYIIAHKEAATMANAMLFTLVHLSAHPSSIVSTAPRHLLHVWLIYGVALPCECEAPHGARFISADKCADRSSQASELVTNCALLYCYNVSSVLCSRSRYKMNAFHRMGEQIPRDLVGLMYLNRG